MKTNNLKISLNLIMIMTAFTLTAETFHSIANADEQAAPSASGSSFSKKHPRRAEVNHRERHQEKRIAKGVKSGKISPEEASKLQSQEAAIKKEEFGDVKANGGSLTKDQKKKLNQELNQVNQELKKDGV